MENKITNPLEHYEARKKLNELFPKRNNSQQERAEFDNLLHEIADYEVRTGMYDKIDIDYEQTK